MGALFCANPNSPWVVSNRLRKENNDGQKARGEVTYAEDSRHHFDYVHLACGCVMEALAFGVLEMPTADVSNEALELDFLHHRGVSSLRAQFGFYPGLSAGVRQDFGGQLLIAKAAILEETQEWPGLALGGDLSLGKRQHLYAVLSKQLGNPSLRAHAAIGLGAIPVEWQGSAMCSSG